MWSLYGCNNLLTVIEGEADFAQVLVADSKQKNLTYTGSDVLGG